MNTLTAFKRVAVGDTFTCAHPSAATRGQRFRKASKRGAFRLLDDPLRPNRGQTHGQIAFARSHAVTV
jgi:hypothetical protein